jgi:hypothetical protein
VNPLIGPSRLFEGWSGTKCMIWFAPSFPCSVTSSSTFLIHKSVLIDGWNKWRYHGSVLNQVCFCVGVLYIVGLWFGESIVNHQRASIPVPSPRICQWEGCQPFVQCKQVVNYKRYLTCSMSSLDAGFSCSVGDSGAGCPCTSADLFPALELSFFWKLMAWA